MVPEGVSVQVNVVTILTILASCITIGGVIWRLSARIKELEVRLEAQGKHHDEQIIRVETEVKHTLQMIELRLKHSDDKDKQILDQLALVLVDMKSMAATVQKIETTNLVMQATHEGRNQGKRDSN